MASVDPSALNLEHVDLAGRSYWDHVWTGQSIPEPFTPGPRNRHTYAEMAFHGLFARLFAGDDRTGKRFLEVGAARSTWLPYFAREYGFTVSGIDYSELGCAQARAILEQAGVDGQILCADFFAPPGELIGQFDALLSFGVIEHFADTADCVEAFARFLRPGGVMISIVPNLLGIGGFLQKRVCRNIYDVHNVLDRRSLRAAHQRAGLDVKASRYFIGGGFVTVNFCCRQDSRFYWAISRASTALSMPFLLLDRIKASARPNRLTSPYVVCIARKPG